MRGSRRLEKCNKPPTLLGPTYLELVWDNVCSSKRAIIALWVRTRRNSPLHRQMAV